MKNYSKTVHDIARAMLKEGLVEEIVAFGREHPGADITPLFISNEADVDKITTMSFYPSSLAGLVSKYGDWDKKIGMIVRTCDARSVVELVKRQQVNRDNLYIIGLECYGVTRKREGDQEIYIFPDEIDVDGEMKPLDEEFLASNCRRCEFPVPTMADVSLRIEKSGETSAIANTEKGRAILKAADITGDGTSLDLTPIKERAARWQEKDFGELRNMSREDRLKYWLSQFDKCIKCYGCRDSCPICFCDVCALFPEKPYIQAGQLPPENLFHIIRLMHIGDSCCNCGHCEANCPMDIPLSKLFHMLNKELSEYFGYEPGIKVSTLPPVSSIEEKDFMKTGVDLD